MTDHSTRDLIVAEKLGELTATVNGLVLAVSDLKSDLVNRHGKLDDRVSALEAWRYKLLGAAGVLAYIAQFIPKPF